MFPIQPRSSREGNEELRGFHRWVCQGLCYIAIPYPSMGLAYVYLHEWLICMGKLHSRVYKYHFFMDPTWQFSDLKSTLLGIITYPLSKGILSRWFSFPQVGYVGSLEGIFYQTGINRLCHKYRMVMPTISRYILSLVHPFCVDLTWWSINGLSWF